MSCGEPDSPDSQGCQALMSPARGAKRRAQILGISCSSLPSTTGFGEFSRETKSSTTGCSGLARLAAGRQSC